MFFFFKNKQNCRLLSLRWELLLYWAMVKSVFKQLSSYFGVELHNKDRYTIQSDKIRTFKELTAFKLSISGDKRKKILDHKAE